MNKLATASRSHEERLGELETRWKAVELEWSNTYAQLSRLMAAQRTREQRATQNGHATQTPAEIAQAAIIARRQGVR